MTRRTEKVAALLQKEVGEYLVRLELPFMTTISKVEVSPDLKWCKVWVTVLESKSDSVLKILVANSSDLQHELNRKLKMRYVPRISFKIDHGEEYASHINELLRKTHE